MYTTTRNIAGGTLMTCRDCGHAISMNKVCEKSLQSATDMRKHIAAHNASRALAPGVPVGVLRDQDAVLLTVTGLLLPTGEDYS